MEPFAPGKPPLFVPSAFVDYACERSLLCCEHPVRAPVPRADRPRMLGLLARTGPGRLIAETLAERVTHEWPGSAEPVWRQRDGRCVNLAGSASRDAASLDTAARACELHAAAGLEALPSSCRNYPRWVTELPDRTEVAFSLTCPTAARLLATSRAPWALVPLHDDAWPYAATLRVAGDVPLTVDRHAPLADVLALREAWWAALDAAREDPGALLATLARMAHAPLDPGASATPPLDRELAGGVAQTALSALERLPDRAAYTSVRWEVFAELAQPMSARALDLATDPVAAPLARFASHGLQWVGVHDPRPVDAMMRIVVRRALLVVRLVDALCARVPYPLSTLVRDTFCAASYIDA
ncbi:MAG: hypothetical protein IT385_12105 [Deltaproteobacteria bacterium]|nr:hypothetical protein [Deltaproteobacteria bacterium]